MMQRLLLDWVAPAGAHARLTVLIFHRVFERADPLLPSEPDALRFEQQMGWIKSWFRVMPLTEGVERLRTGSLRERALSITFDDGYADNHAVALPILRRLGLHATFFVATGFLGGGRMFNDTVIEAIRAARVPRLDLTDLGLGTVDLESTPARRKAIDHVLRGIKHLPPAERADKVSEIAERIGENLPNALMMSQAQVRALHEAGMGIGGHTVHHPILTRCTEQEAHREISEGKDALEQIIGAPITLFAYPNGRPGQDYSSDHVNIVRKLGFAAAVSTAPGTAMPGCDLFQIPRFTPWDREAWRYALRLAINARNTALETV